jgi:hypothetical protein
MFPPNPQTKKYDLRWRFDYANRLPAYGKWSSPGNSPELQAWRQNREGLVRASVEGQDVATQVIKTLAECDGWDFVNFQWMAVAMSPASLVGVAQPVHALVGLKVVTREVELCVHANGEVERRVRPEAEKKMNFATFGR